jgi:hypothetical protein
VSGRRTHPHADEMWRPRRAVAADLPLFETPATTSVTGTHARLTDPPTARAAAEQVTRDAGKLRALQLRVLEAVRELGPIDGAALEALPRFASLGFSTCRKRLSELRALGLIREHDVITRPGRGRITRWVAVERGERAYV